MAISTGDIYRGSIKYLVDEQVCFNVFHARATISSTTAGALTAMNNMQTRLVNIATEIMTGAHSSTLATQISISFVAGLGDPHGKIHNLNLPGQHNTSEMMPGFVAGVVRHSTDMIGRSRRGRTHVIGMTEAQCNGGRLTADGETRLTGIGVALANNWITFTGWRAVVFSPTLTTNQQTPFSTDIVSYSWSELLGTMYSRRIGVGS